MGTNHLPGIFIIKTIKLYYCQIIIILGFINFNPFKIQRFDKNIDDKMCNIINYLTCPVCKHNLELMGDSLLCNSCNIHYKKINGIPDLLPHFLDDSIKNSIQSWEGIKFDYNDYIDQSSIERLQAIDKPLLEQCQEGGTVLEVGCGTARLRKEVEKSGSTYFGIDPSLKLLEQGYDGKNNLIRGVGEYLPFADDSFDTIIAGYHSFRYIDLEKGYLECSRVLKPGGTFAFTLWNYWGLKLYSLANRIRHFRISLSDLSFERNHATVNDVMWVGRVIDLLKGSGFEVASILSTKNLPIARFRFLKDIFGWSGYWHGSGGSLVGYDIIFICKKT